MVWSLWQTNLEAANIPKRLNFLYKDGEVPYGQSGQTIQIDGFKIIEKWISCYGIIICYVIKGPISNG